MPNYGKRDLVLDAIAHKNTTHIPHMILCQPAAERKLLEYYSTKSLDEILLNDIVWIADPSADYLRESSLLRDGEYIDLWGVQWHGVGETRGQVKEPALREATLEGYRFPERFSPDDIARMQDVATQNKGLYRVAKLGAMWEQATFLRGMTDLLTDMVLHPMFVHALLDGILEVLLNNLEIYKRELEVECLWLSDDYGAQDRLLMSPVQWREFISPRLQRICEAVHSAGFHFVLHSDGNTSSVISDIVNIGMDILHPVQPECIDVTWAKREFGQDLTLWGAYGTQGTLAFGTPTQVEGEVEDLCRTLGAGGGFILSPGLAFQAETPIENMVSFIAAAQKWGTG